jgi:5'-nucleotidase
VRELVGPEIDIVVSGINHGANVGVNLRYSGTVAAAMEGAIQNIPAVAISSSFEQEPNSVDFDSSAEYSLEILEKLLPMRPGDVFNVNIPRLSRGKPKGIKVALQSQVPYREKYINHKNKGSSAVYQITGQPPYYGQAPYDTAYVEQGYITITALSLDMTNNAKNTELEKIQW